ncbi:MAG: hypothetical protein ACLTFM_14200 [Blautia wexlerae]
MLNIAICDDDIQTTGRMDMLLQEIAKQNFIDIEIEVFWNANYAQTECQFRYCGTAIPFLTVRSTAR